MTSLNVSRKPARLRRAASWLDRHAAGIVRVRRLDGVPRERFRGFGRCTAGNIFLRA